MPLPASHLSYELLGGVPDNEDDGRRALARHLRSQQPVDSLVRRLLAALFDPEQPPGMPVSDQFSDA